MGYRLMDWKVDLLPSRSHTCLICLANHGAWEFRRFTLREAQFVTGGIIQRIQEEMPASTKNFPQIFHMSLVEPLVVLIISLFGIYISHGSFLVRVGDFIKTYPVIRNQM